MSQIKKIPMRKCTGCQEMKAKKDLIRILKTTEQDFVIDTTGKQNGRGAYLCQANVCFEKAIKSKGLERSFKMSIPQAIYENLQREIKQIEAK